MVRKISKKPKYDKFQKYELRKRGIAATAKTSDEYERRIMALAKELGI